MTHPSKWLISAALLAGLAIVGPSAATTALAQTPPAAGHGQHHPGGAAPPPMTGQGMGMPMQGGGMGMMGMMGSRGMPMSMMGGMMEHLSMMRMMRERPEGRLAFLKAELGITDAQLPQWNAYAEAVRAEAVGRGPGMMMGRGMSAVTWADRLASQEARLQQRLESVRKMKGVAAALYAVLTDEQKKTADELLGGPLGGM